MILRQVLMKSVTQYDHVWFASKIEVNMLRLTSISRFEFIIFHSSDDPYSFQNPPFFFILEIGTVNHRVHLRFSIASDRKYSITASNRVNC